MILSILIVILGIRIAINRQFVSDDPDAPAPRAAELADRIDPNTADWQTLAAIPTLGQNRAMELVAYRTRFAAEHAGRSAYGSPKDLMHIKGIGAAMVENLEPYLLFPPVSQPATHR